MAFPTCTPPFSRQAERKVQNKYIPPDFDPAKLQKGFGSKTNKCEVRAGVETGGPQAWRW